MIKFLEFIGKLVASGEFSVADLAYNSMVLQILLWFGLLILIALMFIQTRKTNTLLQKMCEAENIELPKPLTAKIKEVLTKKW